MAAPHQEDVIRQNQDLLNNAEEDRLLFTSPLLNDAAEPNVAPPLSVGESETDALLSENLSAEEGVVSPTSTDAGAAGDFAAVMNNIDLEAATFSGYE